MAGTTLLSTAFNDHALIPRAYSGGAVSPELQWSQVPDETAEPALLCEDPDAPGGTFTYRLVVGIPPGTNELESGAELTGCAVGRDDFGRYFFRLYALSAPTGLGEGFSAKDFRRAIEGDVLASGTLVGTYGR
ncbi:YbhB/YbcL family Raf kinase inhibitor-like protein [Nonomuraea africana]|uniref:Phosphatidylethanolamine-binding protein (PEBP) family uncharacterized protein n=2 Tax=Nonomuraea africana TaxID=46171 RepID=A0ABR9KPR3_9ACTN|nr:YbhB/YbcL family Raf kinase inhibitor-like protein [Nonomuraea africana]MBE1564009.1 phosphatidylethanolamine-binding protein (PEBP) family uncharacterized protein [Nonomuraea africana]